MLWDPFLYCINDSIQGNSETGNKVFVLSSEVSINIYYSFLRAAKQVPTLLFYSNSRWGFILTYDLAQQVNLLYYCI